MSKPLTLLLVNVHSAANAGDAVLNAAALAQLDALFPQARFVLAMNDPDSVGKLGMEGVLGERLTAVGSWTYWAKTRQAGQTGWDWNNLGRIFLEGWRRGQEGKPRPWTPLLNAYHQADIVLSCPGNFLYSSGFLGLPFWLTIYSMAYALWLGKPLILLPQTIGPLRRWWERRLVRWLIRRAQLVFVRDALSLALLQELNGGKPLPHVHLAPDIAFAYPAPPAALGRQFLAAYDVPSPAAPRRPLLGVTLLDWGAQNPRFGQQTDYETAVALSIRAFIQATGGQAVLFSQVHGPQPADDDRRPAQRVYAQLQDLGEQVKFIPDECPAATLKSAYGQMDFFLGSRLHSCIFALTMGVPVIAVQYQYKTVGVMAMLGMEAWVLPIEQVAAQPACLAQRLLAGWEIREELRATITQHLPWLMSETTAVAQKIHQQYTQTQP